MKKLPLLLLCVTAGCGGPLFRNVGVVRGVGISTESIESYAAEHGVTTAEALAQLKIEANRRLIEDHAAKYGISEEEAKRQLEYAASAGRGD